MANQRDFSQTFANALYKPWEHGQCLDITKRGRQTYHEAAVFHRAEHRTFAQLRAGHSRTANTKRHSGKVSRVVAVGNRFEHLEESLAIPRRMWWLLELDGLLGFAPGAMSTCLFILRQLITKMLCQGERKTLLPSDQISDLVHTCQVLLLADFQLFVHAVGKSIAVLYAGWQRFEHQVHVFHAFHVELNVPSFVPVIQLCNDGPSWDIFDPRS